MHRTELVDALGAETIHSDLRRFFQLNDEKFRIADVMFGDTLDSG